MIWEVIICCLFVFLRTMDTEHISVHTGLLGGRKSKHDFLNFRKLRLTKAILYNCCIYLIPNCGYRAALRILSVPSSYSAMENYCEIKMCLQAIQLIHHSNTFRIIDIIQKANEYDLECHLYIWYWFAMFVITASFHWRADLCRSTQHSKKL